MFQEIISGESSEMPRSDTREKLGDLKRKVRKHKPQESRTSPLELEEDLTDMHPTLMELTIGEFEDNADAMDALTKASHQYLKSSKNKTIQAKYEKVKADDEAVRALGRESFELEYVLQQGKPTVGGNLTQQLIDDQNLLQRWGKAVDGTYDETTDLINLIVAANLKNKTNIGDGQLLIQGIFERFKQYAKVGEVERKAAETGANAFRAAKKATIQKIEKKQREPRPERKPLPPIMPIEGGGPIA